MKCKILPINLICLFRCNMGSAADKIQPQEVNSISSLANVTSSLDYKNQRRKTTDVCFFVVHSLFLVLLAGFIVYCANYADINRILRGYDSCGYICGKINKESSRDPKLHCNADNSHLPLLLVYNPTYGHIPGLSYDVSVPSRKCVKSCDHYQNFRQILNRCLPVKISSADTKIKKFTDINLKDFAREVTEDFRLCWRETLYLCLIALGFSIVIVILLRYLAGIVVWLVLVIVALGSIAGTAYIWIIWKNSKEETDNNIDTSILAQLDIHKTVGYLTFAIIATIITVCILLVILVMRKRIDLVIQLFKESGKALGAMPLLLFEPLLTFIVISGAIAAFVYCVLLIESAGHLTFIRESYYNYEKDVAMLIARWINIFAFLWTIQFIIGCQQMVIAGAVAAWYFTRNKKRLGSPVFYSFYNLTRYHIGSVCFGSFVIALVQLLRIILSLVQRFVKKYNNSCANCVLKCCQCCLYIFEKIIKYISRNAYIEIAIRGYPFCKAGQVAFKILTSNALRVAAINAVGDFVLFLGKVIVVMATVVLGIQFLQNKEGVQHIWAILTVCGVFAFFVSHCFLTVYEMAIDTIFICFCEDCEQNDGLSRPYYMSRDLMHFVENSKKALRALSSEREAAHSQSPKLVTTSNT
ncbi:choline transporter-like protein 1 [Agrilus planipennis]|uniref:Choline transporter-like protein n=1 Tax=Agrilus planipennis TaxID=224129 RepID=A0A7F5QXL3_AGRPL|nr:choline transporter-like protein 1 [Agrilus planipennis]